MHPEGRKEGCEKGESVLKKADTRIEGRGKSRTKEKQRRDKDEARIGQERGNIYRLLQKSR